MSALKMYFGEVPKLVTVHTWAIGGENKVASGDTDYLCPMNLILPPGCLRINIAAVRYSIHSGTSAQFSMKANGSNITDFTDLVATTTTQTANATAIREITESLVPVISAVAGTPKNMSITVILVYT